MIWFTSASIVLLSAHARAIGVMLSCCWLMSAVNIWLSSTPDEHTSANYKHIRVPVQRLVEYVYNIHHNVFISGQSMCVRLYLPVCLSLPVLTISFRNDSRLEERHSVFIYS